MSSFDDVQYDDGQCPKCGEWGGLRSRYCDAIGCDDGFIDEADYDPINFAPGEELTVCAECYGTGNVRWCSKCGHDLNRAEWMNRQAQHDDEQ